MCPRPHGKSGVFRQGVKVESEMALHLCSEKQLKALGAAREEGPNLLKEQESFG